MENWQFLPNLCSNHRVNEQKVWSLIDLETVPIVTACTGVKWHHTLAIEATLVRIFQSSISGSKWHFHKKGPFGDPGGNGEETGWGKFTLTNVQEKMVKKAFNSH